MFLFRKISILTVLITASQTLSAQSAYDNIKKMKENRAATKQMLADCLAAFENNSATAIQDFEKRHENLETALNESETKHNELKTQLGDTPLAQQIIQSETNATRESPVRVKLEFCDVPAAYAPQLSVNRFLMSCVALDATGAESADQKACLDVSEAFMSKNWNATKAGTANDKSFKCYKRKMQ